MPSFTRTASLVVLLAVTAVAWPAGQQGQLPQGAGQQPVVGSGFIAGQVLDAVSGKPIPEASVQLIGRLQAPQAAGLGRGNQPPQPQTVLTDAQGRFFFANLVPAMYATSVMKTGYLSDPFSSIELAENERVMNWKIRVAKLASLAGTLRDEAGDPVVNTDVFVVRRGVVGGRQSWHVVAKPRSDDRGMYRASGLTAGDYLVCACSRDPIPFDPVLLTTLAAEPLQLMTVAARALSVGSDVVSLDSTLRTYAPTFHPNSATLARAAKITVIAGEEKTGIDVNLPLVRATRISGAVVGAQGPVQASSMRLVPEADAEAGVSLFSLQPMLMQPDGRFDFATVPPGQYRLVIVHRPNLPLNGPSGAAMAFVGSRGAPQPAAGATAGGRGAGPVEPPMWASQSIAVGEGGLSGVVVTLNRALAVTGRVQWVGGAPQPPAQMLQRASVTMQPVSPSDPLASMSGTATGRFSPDATFVVPGALPGKYNITSNALPGFPTLKSVMVGGLDLTDMPLVVADKDISDVVITYVDTPLASLTVTLLAAPGGPAGGDQSSILVFPADRRYWTEPAAARRRFREIGPTVQNVYTAPQLPAGDYLVVFASALDAADWMEATKLGALERKAQRVTVPDTGKASIEVRR